MLCCIFNYPPLYRQSIYKKIDESYDVQFYFGRETIEGKVCGIKKLDMSIFKYRPIEIKNKLIGNKFLWRTGIALLPVRKKYTAFLITGDFPLSYIPFLILCKICSKKVYAWGHGIKKICGMKSAILNKFFYNTLDGFFVYGEKGKQRLTDLGFQDNKLHVIYNSLVDKIRPSEQMRFKSDIYQSHFKNPFKTIIFIGRLTSVKKLDLILRVMHEHRQKGLNYNLMLIGEGEEKENLMKLSSDLGLCQFVWFYGACYDETQLSILLYNADVCVAPGNVGLTAMHCMQYGVPVITHDNFEEQMPEYESIVEWKTGLLYKYGNFEDLGEKIHAWLSLGNNREKFRQNCYDVINTHYNSDYQIKLIKQVILK